MKKLKILFFLCFYLFFLSIAFAETFTWTGSTSGEWQTASNWTSDQNTVPSISDPKHTIIIPSGCKNYPMYQAQNTAFFIAKIKVESGAKITFDLSIGTFYFCSDFDAGHGDIIINAEHIATYDKKIKITGDNITLKAKSELKLYSGVSIAATDKLTLDCANKNNITIDTSNITANEIDAPNISVEKIEITKKPNKTNYISGGKFNTDGLTLKLTYKTNSNQGKTFNAIVKSGYTTDPANGSILLFQGSPSDLYCKKEVKVSYPNCNNPVSFEIVISKQAQASNVTIKSNVINANNEDDRTTLEMYIYQEGRFTINVMTADGSVIKNLHNGNITVGTHSFTWNGRNNNNTPVARGIYFIRVVGPNIDETRKVMVVK